MFAVIAFLCFLLGAIGAHLGVNLLYLGLMFLAIHFIIPWRPWGNYVRRE